MPVHGPGARNARLGLTESAKGDLKAKFSQLGTTLIEAGASIVAGLWPSIKAARLEPLATLRLG